MLIGGSCVTDVRSVSCSSSETAADINSNNVPGVDDSGANFCGACCQAAAAALFGNCESF